MSDLLLLVLDSGFASSWIGVVALLIITQRVSDWNPECVDKMSYQDLPIMHRVPTLLENTTVEEPQDNFHNQRGKT